MTKTVYGGDMHCVVSEIDECQRLVDGMIAFALRVGAQRICFLGDLHDTMSAVRVEVLAFWKRAFAQIHTAGLEVVVLVGNHDYDNAVRDHVLIAYPEVTVVDRPLLRDGVLYLPYMADQERFLEACRAYPQARTLVCHQTFQGAEYENGFYAGPEAIDPAAVPQPRVISGHIHKPAVLGKIWYVGAPRWRIATDANEERRVYAVTHSDEGDIVTVEEMDTATVCRRTYHLQDIPAAPAAIPPGALPRDVRVDVTGPTDYVRARTAELEALGVRVRAFRTDAVRVEVRESEGIPRAWDRFLGAHAPRRGTPVKTVRQMAAKHYGLTA